MNTEKKTLNSLRNKKQSQRKSQDISLKSFLITVKYSCLVYVSTVNTENKINYKTRDFFQQMYVTTVTTFKFNNILQ